MATTGEAVVRLLEQYGTDTVFGIPGVHTLEIYRGLAASSIRHVAPRHEQGARLHGRRATAASRGRPGVCVLITGPGVTNALTPVAQAYHDSIPHAAWSAPTARRDRGTAVGTDPRPARPAAPAPSTVTPSATRATGTRLADAFARAWDVFESARPRPVHIEVPVDVLRPARPAS